MSKTNKFEEKYETILKTILLYPDQLQQSLEEFQKIAIPDSYKDILNIVFCGMGGSALGARIVKSLLSERMRIPFEIYNGYHLPKYAYEKTLVVVSSYSGGTEETINNFYEALNRHTKVFGITTGGKLGDLLKENSVPSYYIDPKNNPSGQPRMSIGYAIGATFALLNKLEVFEMQSEEVFDAIKVMKQKGDEFTNKDQNINLALRFSENIYGKIPILVASEHLIGTAHTVKNQFNESAKTFSALFDIPELNHHLMEGLKNPAKERTLLSFLFFNSDLYSERVKLRYPITQDVVEKNGYEFMNYQPSSESKVSQAFEVLMFGSFIVYYLSKKYGVDPTVIPWVDYFKEKLSKSTG